VIGKEPCYIQLCSFLPFTVEGIGSIFHKSPHFIVKYVYSEQRNCTFTAVHFITINTNVPCWYVDERMLTPESPLDYTR